MHAESLQNFPGELSTSSLFNFTKVKFLCRKKSSTEIDVVIYHDVVFNYIFATFLVEFILTNIIFLCLNYNLTPNQYASW